MEDEIDIDAISAMLDDDSENQNSENSTFPNSSEKSQDAKHEESSDDDIDESELDKLATLMEEETVNEDISKSSPVAISQNEQTGSSQTSDALHQIDQNLNISKSSPVLISQNEQTGGSQTSDALDQIDQNSNSSNDNNDETSDEADENDALAAQMRLLQEQMKHIQEKLNKKTKTPIKKKQGKHLENRKLPDGPSQNTVKQNDEKTPPKKVSTIPAKSKTLKEFNIFDIINNDKKADPVEKQVVQPWERKHTRPTGNLLQETASVKPKITCTENEKKVNQKLKSTVEKITSKMTSCVAAVNTSNNDLGLEKELFGDDSGSDWEDLEGEKNARLSNKGKELDKLLKKHKSPRIAHTPTYDQEKMMHKKETNWNTSKPSFYGSTSQNVLPSTKVVNEVDDTISRDPFSGIHISKPLISSLEMKSRMSGRKLIKMSHLHRRINTSDTESDWVTMGVIVSKSEPKMSSKNTQYSIWKVTDLEDCDRLVTLFLFGNVHKELWKHTVGSVIGLLNPTYLKSSEKYQKKDADEVSITIDSPQKLMLMGYSKDMGTCKSTTKAGRKCTNVINMTKGEHCSYHVQAAYKKTSAKRSELQAGFTGVTPRSFEKKIFSKANSTVMYGGQSFTTASSCNTGTKKAKNQISLKGLQHHTVIQGPNGKVNTLKVHNLMPEMKEAQKQLKEYEQKAIEKEKVKAEKHKAFHGLLSTPTIGATNFVKHLAKKENMVIEEKKDKKPTTFVSPSEFLKNAERERRQKQKEAKQYEIHRKLGIKLADASNNFHPSVVTQQVSAKDAVKKVPTLGRGFGQGDDIDLDVSCTSSTILSKAKLEQAFAKKKAIAKIKAAGGIKKEDPNAVKTLKSPETQERLKRRLEDRENDSEDDNLTNGEPAKKKSRLLGDLDMDDPEVQKVLKAKSSHAAALTQEEQERQDQYFEVLEKKEAMEEKMASITKIRCKSFSCKQCVYTSYSQSQFCKDQGHKVTVQDAWKRFFKCKTCQHRTASLDKLPKTNCRNCGSSNFERATMLKEKKGPILPGEELLLRGEERKFVNS